MSAGICIMNRNAIAMAADSAVTIGDHAAIHNSANKLFSLSKVAPVGAIIFANSMFMCIPVEIIIKEYQKHLGNRIFSTLKEYVEDFLFFLEKENRLFRFTENEETFIINVFLDVMRGMQNGFNKFSLDTLKGAKRELNEREKKRVGKQAFEQTIDFIKAQQKKNTNFKDFVKVKYLSKFIELLKTNTDFSWLNENQINKLCDAMCEIYDTDFARQVFVGVAIAGYGNNEIFPHMIQINLCGVINGKVSYSIIREVEITESTPASILPLAQTDVMETFLFGINDQFINYLAQTIPLQIQDSLDRIDDDVFVKGKKDLVRKELHGITQKVIDHMSHTVGSQFIQQFLLSVATLPIDELALLAESLINITSVKRKVAIDRNIGTVGGPIDVAIVSKGDGFIWLKRKHYFDRKYNPQYYYSHFELGRERETENE